MKKTTGAYPRVQVDTTDNAAVGQAGGVVLVETIRISGLDTALSAALDPTVSRLVDALTDDVDRALSAIEAARAAARAGCGLWPAVGHPTMTGRRQHR